MPHSSGIPVFHPAHPHNRQPYPLYESSQNIPSSSNSSSSTGYGLGFTYTHGHGHGLGDGSKTKSESKMNHCTVDQRQRTGYEEEVPSDSESSLSPSPRTKGRCFCGQPTLDGGIYCSVSCARSDAFSSLCYKPTAEAVEPSLSYSHSSYQPSIAGAISASLSRNPSSASASSIASASSSNQDVGEWTASHYRRLARADIRRDERREERRRRRAEGSLASSISTSRSTMMSTSSSSSRAVPDLVGGGGASHSRNPSIASSITSMSSSNWGPGASLSRNGSSASTMSRRGYGNNVHVDSVIHEDDDEEEWLQSEMAQPCIPAVPIHSAQKPRHKRTDSRSTSGRKGRKATPDPLPFGMGKDMRDVLEEIIQMEKSFLVSDNDDNEENDEDDSMAQSAPTAGLFTSQFDRPPRTPSPVSSGKRRVSIAPGAPIRGHRSALSQSAAGLDPSYHAPAAAAPQRPPSLMGLHQSSLSESHTALYLATASPVHKGRRSASPQLETRKSITFTPDAAGPSISFDGLPAPRRVFDSPSTNLTPMGRRRLNLTPQAVHPPMKGWRFPSGSAAATPTRPSTAQIPSHDEPSTTERIEPALLWPAPRDLQPALFPSSPAIDTPDFPSSLSHSLIHSRSGIQRTDSGNVIEQRDSFSAPGSGMRLGVLLGSGTGESDEGRDDDNEMDLDMDMELEEEGSTEHGHSHGRSAELGHETHRGRMAYLPVFLEAEGFRSNGGVRQW